MEMRLIITPQRGDYAFSYALSGDVLTITIDGVSDEFNFTGLSDGTAGEMATSLPVNPVICAEKTNGELTVRIIAFHGENASAEEKTEREVVSG
jgi:hypothetical protein